MPKRLTYYEEVKKFQKATEKRLNEMEDAPLPRGVTLRDVNSRFKRLNLLKKAFNLCEKQLGPSFEDELTPNLPMEEGSEKKK